jgi:hypothetical protein
MGNYSFLASLKVTDPGRIRTPKTKNPEKGLTLRIFADGTVYPSQELIDKFKLEFRHQADPEQGNGFDIVDTKFWKPLAEHPRMLMFGVTPKAQSKVDLFATTRHHEDGTAKSSVLTRGEGSMVLLTLVKEFGWLTEEQKYVDLTVILEHPFTTSDGIAFIPKTIEKGARKGEQDYKRRDNITFYPVEMVVEAPQNAIEKSTVVTI